MNTNLSAASSALASRSPTHTSHSGALSTSSGLASHSTAPAAPTYPLTTVNLASSAKTSSEGSPILLSTAAQASSNPQSTSLEIYSYSLTPVSSTSSVSPTTQASLTSGPIPLSSLSAVLSTLDVTGIIQSKSEAAATTTPPPTSSLLSPPELTSSVSAALTLGGVPASIASSLVPIIVGSQPASTSLSPSASALAVLSQEAEQAAIEAFIQWLLSFFHGRKSDGS